MAPLLAPAETGVVGRAQFGDSNWYSLDPDGGFEGTKSAWTASSGASIVSGTRPTS
jgi:hypothetical protein